MLDSVLTYSATGSVTLTSLLICMACSLILGVGIAAAYRFHSSATPSFVATLALLPVIVQVVILLVNGNLGAGVAVLGAFSLVRFRSAPGSAREISAIFFAMAIGLIAGSYSSIAIACPLYCMWKTREPKFAKLQKKYGTEIGLFEFDHSASTGIAQVPLARLEAQKASSQPAATSETTSAAGATPGANPGGAVAVGYAEAGTRTKKTTNKKKKHKHGRAQ